MVGDHAPAQRYDSEFDECPECGERMHKSAKLCQACHVKQPRTIKSVDQERRERFDLALAAGWTLDDIFGFDPDEEYDPSRDKLPTREQIVKRMIKNWFKEGDND